MKFIAARLADDVVERLNKLSKFRAYEDIYIASGEDSSEELEDLYLAEQRLIEVCAMKQDAYA